MDDAIIESRYKAIQERNARMTAQKGIEMTKKTKPLSLDEVFSTLDEMEMIPPQLSLEGIEAAWILSQTYLDDKGELHGRPKV